MAGSLASPDLVLKQHDTGPPLTATLSDQNGPINLTNATTITFIMKGQRVTITDPCIPVNPAAGQVIYVWGPSDLALVDVYQVEFQITWNDGTIQTVPNGGYAYIQVIADLGP